MENSLPASLVICSHEHEKNGSYYVFNVSVVDRLELPYIYIYRDICTAVTDTSRRVSCRHNGSNIIPLKAKTQIRSRDSLDRF